MDPILLKEEARADLERLYAGSPEFHNVESYVSSILDEPSSSRNAAHYARKIRSLARRRAALSSLRNLDRALSNGHTDEEVSPLLDELAAAWAAPDAQEVELEPLTFAGHETDIAPPVAVGHPEGEALIAAGDMTTLVSDSGTGKSLALLDLGIAWTTAQPWMGFPCAPDLGGVLFLSSDGDGAEPTRARVVRLGAGRNLTREQLDALPLDIISADGFDLDSPASFAALERMVSERDPGIVILETLSSLMGPDRDPYHPGDTQAFIQRRLRPLQARPDGTRRTVIVSHHLRKKASTPGANNLKDRVAGSFRMVGAVDSVIAFEPGGDSGFKVRLTKTSRWGLRFQPFACVIDGDPPGPLSIRNTGALTQSAPEKAADETRALEALSALASTAPESYFPPADIKRKAGLTEQEARGGKGKRLARALKRLEEAGTIEASPGGRTAYRPAHDGAGLPLEEDLDA